MSLSRKEKNAYWMPYTDNKWFKGNPKLLESAKGMYYTTSKGEKILDGVAGLWCVNAGHCRSKIVEAVKDQVEKMDYGLSFQMGHRLAFEFAEKLVDILPKSINHVFFSNSGSEAVDSALKVALAYFKAKGKSAKNKFIGRARGYHGSGFGGTSVGGIIANRSQFGNLLNGIIHLPHTHMPEKNSFSWGQPKHGIEKAEALNEIIDFHGKDSIAAVIVEPIAGSTGVLVPPVGYLEKLREICDHNDILLIFDEVITGFGRVGSSFASERFKVVPDIMTMAKGITNATVPMGAIGVKSEIYDTIHKKNKDKIELFHGYTYSGHPLACAAGLATLEVYEDEKLFKRARSLEKYFGNTAHALSKLNVVKDIRNFGLVAGIELSERSNKPNTLGRDVYEECFKNGLMVRFTGNTIAISPPLIIEKNQIDEIFNILQKAIKKVF
ncbi:MAG: aspartate aminotransferase family protein [Rickettsiales bacterium]|nr:aspartate aminotransferase family protein [Rickettsiales bacterium]OUV75290.1 MAG: aspartate aminotransferase family protein [Rickettsiales bacterium TMED131]|tara:strand:- start:265 stop:1581 length:1317 start_codon:yes stop_codon:yes gene_type:complete